MKLQVNVKLTLEYILAQSEDTGSCLSLFTLEAHMEDIS